MFSIQINYHLKFFSISWVRKSIWFLPTDSQLYHSAPKYSQSVMHYALFCCNTLGQQSGRQRIPCSQNCFKIFCKKTTQGDFQQCQTVPTIFKVFSSKKILKRTEKIRCQIRIIWRVRQNIPCKLQQFPASAQRGFWPHVIMKKENNTFPIGKFWAFLSNSYSQTDKLFTIFPCIDGLVFKQKLVMKYIHIPPGFQHYLLWVKSDFNNSLWTSSFLHFIVPFLSPVMTVPKNGYV